MKTVLAAVAALAIASSASAASANPFARDQAVLDLKGLDLSSADGQERLAIRIDEAARAVCGQRLANVHLALEAKAQECRTSVVADVRSQIEARMARAGGAAVKVASAR
ncbi:MAG: UrcA family protein [Novosphingobium sp.]